MKILHGVLILIVFFSFTGLAQIPEKFAPGIISNDGVFGLTLSSDGKTALWISSKGKRDTLVVKESHFINGAWSPAITASFSSNGEWKDIDPVFTPDGKRVLFQSTRPVPGRPDRKGFDIWIVDVKVNGWSDAYHLGNEINTDVSESYASMTRSGNIYFMKENANGVGSSDIYVSRMLNKRYQAAENIGLPINSNNRESNPFISAGEDFLIYFSDDSTGYGDVDLMISFKTKKGWSTPVNLGHEINTSEAEFCPFYHAKQRRLYFARQHKEGDRLVENIFAVEFDPNTYRK
jgi:hypothetical protein